MVSRVNSVIAEKLAIDPLSIVGVNRLIEDLGADELDYIEIIMDIEEEFDIEIPDVDLASLLTVGDIYEYLGNVLKIDL
ncbi:acyl carrier protein [Sphingobacterium alkalisoli]|uniref:Acyl carrier protein n=2 Tax=Sphingobacterium alkalisoli TaxID=1874115 RepID=A0A4V5LWR8_9SPHI|nr:acyl carrier protein [Sphingobacterium alkalisoli]